MKSLKGVLSTLLLAVTMATATAHGGEEKDAQVQMRYLSNQIISLITYPEFIVGKMGEHSATIHFQVNENGKLVVEKVEASTLGLSGHIEKLLDQKQMYTDSMLFGKSYSLRVSFL